MNTFAEIQKIVGQRRPGWAFIIEDDIIRILTRQFVVDFDIFQAIIDTGNFKIVDIITHRELGVVFSIHSIAAN